MAITLRQTGPAAPAAPAFTDVFSSVEMHHNTPAGERALRAGILAAKREAHKQAEKLSRWGRPLLLGIIFVSATHMIETIAGYKPESVTALHLWTILYHATAILLTLGIDLTALYLVAAGGTSALAGAPRRPWPVRFFLLTTFLLNAAYIVRYAPSLAQSVKDQVLPVLDMVFVLLLPAAVVVAIPSIETARAILEAAKLKLSVDIVTLQTELDNPSASSKKQGGAKPNKASGSDNVQSGAGAVMDAELIGDDSDGAPIVGGRRAEHSVAALAASFAPGQQFKRADVVALLECSTSTVDRLLGEATESGQVIKLARGVYQRA